MSDKANGRVRQGPLTGVRIVEFAGIGPGPFAGMLLADLGADVIRIDRPSERTFGDNRRVDVTSRSRRSIMLDLRDPAALQTCLTLVERADAIIEGYRPGVMERLGLGPDVLLARNPRLAYGRMTGWGQDGPYGPTAGHDLNYIALSGALHAIGPAERPVPPLNLVGDFGGGALYMAFGLLAAIIHARSSGQGQVVDCAMSEGAASLAAMFYGMFGGGMWKDERQANMLDGAAPFYAIYGCADGKWISVAAIEPQFYAELLEKLGLDPATIPSRNERADWPALRKVFDDVFAQKTRDEWSAIFDGSDACVAPVLNFAEAPGHPHNVARGNFIDVDGITQPAPAPRFLSTPGAVQGPPPQIGAHGDEILAEWGVVAATV